jgi:hypothetical protein
MTPSVVPKKDRILEETPLIAPHWGLVFILIGGALLLVIGIPVRLILGLSGASDQVFAVEAFGSGIAADLLLRRFARRKLVVAPNVGIPLLYVWSLLCGYVFVARPFE